MKTYLVGGAVRDLLLGEKAHDRDYVVVGATPTDMLAAGYKQVGADFPVFLHPVTGAEYALARIERKVGAGYRGFAVTADGVTLEDDLLRRDLTINAMAIEVDPSTDQLLGELVDPYGGMRDLKAKVLRHTSQAFAEDPLRVLRVARFISKMPDFTVAAETDQLCYEMVARGDLQGLTQERVWLETYKALDAVNPMFYFQFLQRIGAESQAPGLGFLAHCTHRFMSTLLAVSQNVQDAALRKDIVMAYMLVGPNMTYMPNKATLKGLHANVNRAAEILCMNWYDFQPDALYERLVKSGSFRDWGFVKDVLVLFSRVTVESTERALRAAEAVTAASFPRLEGKALGEAIKQQRAVEVARCLR